MLMSYLGVVGVTLGFLTLTKLGHGAPATLIVCPHSSFSTMELHVSHVNTLVTPLCNLLQTLRYTWPLHFDD